MFLIRKWHASWYDWSRTTLFKFSKGFISYPKSCMRYGGPYSETPNAGGCLKMGSRWSCAAVWIVGLHSTAVDTVRDWSSRSRTCRAHFNSGIKNMSFRLQTLPTMWACRASIVVVQRDSHPRIFPLESLSLTQFAPSIYLSWLSQKKTHLLQYFGLTFRC